LSCTLCPCCLIVHLPVSYCCLIYDIVEEYIYRLSSSRSRYILYTVGFLHRDNAKQNKTFKNLFVSITNSIRHFGGRNFAGGLHRGETDTDSEYAECINVITEKLLVSSRFATGPMNVPTSRCSLFLKVRHRTGIIPTNLSVL